MHVLPVLGPGLNTCAPRSTKTEADSCRLNLMLDVGSRSPDPPKPYAAKKQDAKDEVARLCYAHA